MHNYTSTRMSNRNFEAERLNRSADFSLCQFLKLQPNIAEHVV